MMSHDLQDKLDKLAPLVDETAARNLIAEQGRLASRRRIVGGTILAVVVAGTAVFAVWAFSEGGRNTLTAGQPPESGEAEAATTAGGLALQLELDSNVIEAGSDVGVSVTLRNDGSEVVQLIGGEGSCDPLVEVWAGGQGSGPPAELRPSNLPKWEPSSQSLSSWIAADDRTVTPFPVSLDATGMAGGCNDVFMTTTLQPGAEESFGYTWVAATGADPGAEPLGDAALVAQVSLYRSPREPGETLRVELPLTVVDEPGRLDSAESALAAFESASELADYVENVRDGGFIVELSWIRGTWELWVVPAMDDAQSALRLQFDPASESVTSEALSWGDWMAHTVR